MDVAGRRRTLWSLASLLALPFLPGPLGLVRALLARQAPGDAAQAPGPARPRITPPDRSVKRHD